MDLVFDKANIEEYEQIHALYQEVIRTTFTTWDDNYPGRDLIMEDIMNGDMYVLKNGNNIIAVSFLGIYENEAENWSNRLDKPIGIARICVDPKWQGRGVGTYFVYLLMEKAKEMGADGMHFHVCTLNASAMKMYERAGFINCGQGESNYGYDYYKYEIVF